MIEIDCDFPGGNVLCDGIEGDTVRLRQDQRDTRVYSWFYWYFRVRGAAGRTVRFVFEDPVIGVRGPGVSTDGGATWAWLGSNTGDEHLFAYTFPAGLSEARFSFGMPYTEASLDRFLAAHAATPHLRSASLCRSRKGRRVEMLAFGQVHREPKHRVLLTCRHHCCEMMASYVLEGVIEAVLADGETGSWLREYVEFLAIPFMDKDGVEDGDQGKGRDPHDHNRDYTARMYPEVRALQRELRTSRGRLRFALDLHCPGPRGRWHELIHFVGLRQEDLWDRVLALCSRLEESNRGPLPYRTSNNLPFGTDWNTAEEYGPIDGEPECASDWLSRLPGVWFGATVEIPYADAQSAEVNAETARSFGRDLAEAVRRHLAETPCP